MGWPHRADRLAARELPGLCEGQGADLGCFFFHDTATPELYTLSLHDALPIGGRVRPEPGFDEGRWVSRSEAMRDRKSTRLNSSHTVISYAVFCLKKKRPTSRQGDAVNVKRNDWSRREFLGTSAAAGASLAAQN